MVKLLVVLLVILASCSAEKERTRNSNSQNAAADTDSDDDDGDSNETTSVIPAPAGPSGPSTPTTTNPKPAAGKNFRVIATGNPDGINNDVIVRTSKGLSQDRGEVLGFLGVTSIQSIKVSAAGDAYVTMDSDAGGVLVRIKGLFKDDEDSLPASGIEFETIGGGMNTPKGLEIMESEKLILVADTGDKDIKVYDMGATTQSDPVFTVASLGERAVWDVHYDTKNDRLYGAGIDGVVIVYDKFKVNKGAAGPTRNFTPAEGGSKISVNLHGIHYLADSDTLLLSDVGDAASATDGQLFAIAKASKASGLTNVVVRVAGDDTLLGNPVDIAYAEGNLYVAEKSNDLIMRYDAFTTLKGTVSTPADESRPLLKAESVTTR